MVIIIGAGLFGSIIAAALRARGRSVLVIDDARPEAGSRPAACLMKPSWYSGLGKEVYTPALDLLNELYGVQVIVFKVGPMKADVNWCNPAQILKPPDRRDTVRAVLSWGREYHVVLAGERLKASVVIVAAGVWTHLLFPSVKVLGLGGVACLWPGHQIEQPVINPWAPFKQVVAFNRGDGLWAGDGSASKWPWSEQQVLATVKRCTKVAGMVEMGPPQRIFGIRPYMDDEPCFLKELKPNLWAATGGAKNGTIAAAWCAYQLMRRYS